MSDCKRTKQIDLIDKLVIIQDLALERLDELNDFERREKIEKYFEDILEYLEGE